MTYSVAVSSIAFDHKPNAWEYALLHKSFANLYVTTQEELLLYVAEGRSYGAWQDDDGKFLESSIISIDLEGGAAAHIDSATQVEFAQDYLSFAYTTMSDTDKDPRCRMVFLLDRAIENADDYRDTAAAVATMWPKSIVDPQTSQPLRRFLGSPNGRSLVLGKVLPFDVADALCHALRMQKQRNVQPTPSQAAGTFTGSKQAPAFLLTALNELASTPPGGRNAKLNKVAFLFGKLAVAPGHMLERTAFGILCAAGIGSGLGQAECEATALRALRQGMNIGAMNMQYHAETLAPTGRED